MTSRSCLTINIGHCDPLVAPWLQVKVNCSTYASKLRCLILNLLPQKVVCNLPTWVWVACVCMSNPREVKEMTVTSTSSDQLCFAVPYVRWWIVICYNVDGLCFMYEYILFWWITAFVMWRMYVWTYWWSVCLGAHLQSRASASGRNLPNG